MVVQEDMKELTHLSLFSGIGGIDLAAEWAGFQTIAFVEIDKYCQKVLKKHWPNVPIIGDIKDVTWKKIKDVTGWEWMDIITGGDPCQPRSIAGKRRGDADDRDLWSEMFRVVCEFKPEWVVNENPTGRLSMDFGKVVSNLESQGYETWSFVIPACAVNAVHKRDRVFIVAHSDINGLQRWGCDEQPKSYAPPKIFSSQQVPSIYYPIEKWEDIYSQPGLCRKNNGIPTALDRCRLKALGSAVVPQQIYPILKAIADIEAINKW